MQADAQITFSDNQQQNPRHTSGAQWDGSTVPKHISFPIAHGSEIVTCLMLSHGRIIAAFDDHFIRVYSPVTGELIRTLQGHEGGVWAMGVYKDTVVTGSTDRTVRIWDLATGMCTHVFGGHTSTVRCLAIVKPEIVDVDQNGNVVQEKWPKRPLIVTGSRDHSLRVWTLPRPGEAEGSCLSANGAEVNHSEVCDADENPFHRRLLEGHDQAVRVLAARGRTLVSGSYDFTVRIWDIITGECKWTLVGHTQKVYSVVLDLNRKQVYSGSMDGTVRIWNLVTGQCQHTLIGHDSLVGLVALSPTFLVSAGADGKSCVWDPDTGELRQTFAAHTGAVTCFMHDDIKVLSGANGDLKLWNVRDGTLIRDLLTEISGVWQVAFEGRWCVAAIDRSSTLMLDVWDFATEPDNGTPSELQEDDTVSVADSEDEDDPKHKGLKTSMKNELGPNSHDSLVSRDDSRQSESARVDKAVENQGVQGVANENIERPQGASHAIDVGGTSAAVPSDLANGTHANEPETQ